MEDYFALYEDTVKWFHDQYLQIELKVEIEGEKESYGYVERIKMMKGGVLVFEADKGSLVLDAYKIHLTSHIESYQFETELYREKDFGNTLYLGRGVINYDEECGVSEDVWSLSFYQTHQECHAYKNQNKKRKNID
ncbi:hypothetical protein AO073_01700 [Pseudomonas syringae ICMP 11293]|uniref:hypothetical protein n=1 Tax=Pseudomonas syringae TaxID=317 RepID=UPI00073085AE|nr:hypothetical protein [Pseudomonas syringae]KTB91614.1 hypothetical protein AO073_01700 [Pseudomonas syringae ICMP 11293]